MTTKRLIALLLAIVCVLTLAACGGDESQSGNEGNSQAGEANKPNKGNNEKSQWEMEFHGVKFSLPCTMADLEKKGIHLYTEYDEETIYASQNESFVWISAVYEDTHELLLLSIDTGDSPDKKAENAHVVAVTNMELAKELFHMKDDFALGATIDEMEKIFGADYEVPGATGDSIREGFTICQYSNEHDNILFNFRDNELVSIEVQYIEGE